MSDDARRAGEDSAVLDWGFVAGLFTLGLIAYWPIFSYSFFWEDPFDIGQVEPFSYLQLLVAPNSNSYYRPFLLIVLKLLKFGGAFYRPAPYHIFVVVGHLLATAVLYGFARRLCQRRSLALSASLIFLFYPPAFEATARASSFHSWFTALTLAALWLYAWGRQTGRRWPWFASLTAAVLAQGLHENGVLFPGLALALELWLVWQGRLDRFWPGALIFFVPAVAFFFVWLSIPKPAEPPQFGLHPREALYLSQGLSFPFAGLIGSVGGLGLSPEEGAGVALVASVLVLLVAHGRSGRPRLALVLLWWLGANSLAWLLRPIEYLEVSPRVIYFPSFAAALAWGGLATSGSCFSGRANEMPALEAAAGDRRRKPLFRFLSRRRSAVGALIVAAILTQSWLTLSRIVRMYANGSALMKQIVAAGAQAGEGSKLLFVNVPDRFEYRRPLYPLGYWGMLLAPVSQGLSDFVNFAAGVKIETESLSDFPLLASMAEASPYRVNTRGENAHASDRLYDTTLWADETYRTDYQADGELSLRPVGDVREPRSIAGTLGRIGDHVELLEADWQVRRGVPIVTLYWLSLQPFRPTDTIFVHLYNAQGGMEGQGDGDSLGGLLPPSAWRSGHEIVDRRVIVAPAALAPGEYRLTVGMYNRADGSRYPAYDVHGAESSNGELDIARVFVP